MAGASKFLGVYVLASAASQMLLAGAPLAVLAIGRHARDDQHRLCHLHPLSGTIDAHVSPPGPHPALSGANGGDRRSHRYRSSHRPALWRRRRAVFGRSSYRVPGRAGCGTALVRSRIPAVRRSGFAWSPAGSSPPSPLRSSGSCWWPKGRTLALALVWSLGLVVATVVLLVSSLEPLTRVALAFAFGEVIALTAMWRVARATPVQEVSPMTDNRPMRRQVTMFVALVLLAGPSLSSLRPALPRRPRSPAPARCTPASTPSTSRRGRPQQSRRRHRASE